MTVHLFRYISPLEAYHNTSGPFGLMKKKYLEQETYLFICTVLLQTKVVKTLGGKKERLGLVQQFQLIHCFINSLKIKGDTEITSTILGYLFA